jgi:hypothetical protein
MTNAKITAASGVLGAALVVAAGIGWQAIEANAETVPTTVDHPEDELTGPQAAAFASCAEGIWEETTPANVREFVLWRADGVKQAYTVEEVTTHQDVFAPLDIAGGTWPSCSVSRDGTDVTYCIKRGSVELTPVQVACAKAAVEAVIGEVAGVDRVHLRAGPPRTIETRTREDKSIGDYAACRAAGTCRPARTE